MQSLLIFSLPQSMKSLQSRLQKTKSMDLQSPNEVDSMKAQQKGEVFTFDHTSLAEVCTIYAAVVHL